MVWLIVFGSVFLFVLVYSPSRKTFFQSCREFDRIVATNCEENELECRRRMKAVQEALEKEDLPTVQEAYDYIMNLSNTTNQSEKNNFMNSFKDNHAISDDSLKALSYAAVEKDGENLQFVPMSLRTLELCLQALQKNCQALVFVPEPLRSMEEICAAVVHDPFALMILPDALKSLRICILAVRKDSSMLKYVPEELKTDEFLDASYITGSHNNEDTYAQDYENCYGRYAYGEFNEFGFRIEK